MTQRGERLYLEVEHPGEGRREVLNGREVYMRDVPPHGEFVPFDAEGEALFRRGKLTTETIGEDDHGVYKIVFDPTGSVRAGKRYYLPGEEDEDRGGTFRVTQNVSGNVRSKPFRMYFEDEDARGNRKPYKD